jgi:hypothetical protein
LGFPILIQVFGSFLFKIIKDKFSFHCLFQIKPLEKLKQTGKDIAIHQGQFLSLMQKPTDTLQLRAPGIGRDHSCFYGMGLRTFHAKGVNWFASILTL